MTDTLTAFLLARLDEDERIALDANTSPEMVTGIPRSYVDALVAVHISRWNPTRVLAEVDAKRSVMEIHAVPAEVFAGSPIPARAEDRRCVGCGFGSDEEPLTEDINGCPILRALARPYSDHPDYRSEWAPGT